MNTVLKILGRLPLRLKKFGHQLAEDVIAAYTESNTSISTMIKNESKKRKHMIHRFKKFNSNGSKESTSNNNEDNNEISGNSEQEK